MSSWPIRNPITRVVLLKLANVSQEDSLRREINGASQDLERLRETRGNLQNRRDAARKHLGEIKRKFEKSQDQLVRLQKRYDSNRRLKRELTTKLAEIDQEIARSGRDRDGDSAEVKELKKQIDEVENEIAVNHAMITEGRLNIDKVNASIERESAKLAPFKAKIADLQNQIIEMEEAEDSKEQLLHEMKEKYLGLKNQLKKYEVQKSNEDQKMEKVVRDRDRVKDHVDTKIRETTEVLGQRLALEANETKQQIEEKIKCLEERQEKKRQSLNLPDPRVIKNQLLDAKRHLNNHELLRNFIQQSYQDLKDMRKSRKYRFRKMRTYIKRMTGVMFNALLMENNQAGHVVWSHENKTLDVSVRLDTEENNTAVTDTKQLSGGEKSTTTLVLLLSLMFSVDCPFTVMDEFDVCMDEKRRSISLQQLTTIAEKNISRQFIFVTPHSINTIERTHTSGPLKGKKKEWISVWKFEKSDSH